MSKTEFHITAGVLLAGHMAGLFGFAIAFGMCAIRFAETGDPMPLIAATAMGSVIALFAWSAVDLVMKWSKAGKR